MGDAMTFFLPLRTKFIVLFCLLITVPLLLIGTITCFKYQSDVERNTLQLTHQIVDQIRINLDRYIKEAERLTLTPHYDDTVMEILRRHDGPPRDPIKSAGPTECRSVCRISSKFGTISRNRVIFGRPMIFLHWIMKAVKYHDGRRPE